VTEEWTELPYAAECNYAWRGLYCFED
jgi:hypothetical protein